MFRSHASAEDPGPSALPGEPLPLEPTPAPRSGRGAKAVGKRIFDRAVQAARREKVAGLLLQRVTEAEIARMTGVHKSTITKDVRAIMLEWSRAYVGDYHVLVVRELRSLDHDESRLRARLQTYEPKNPPDGSRPPLDPEIEGLRLRLVDRILRIGERRAKILGLDSPDRLELTGRDGGPIEMTGGEAARRVMADPVAAELACAMIDRLAELGPSESLGELPPEEIEPATLAPESAMSSEADLKEASDG